MESRVSLADSEGSERHGRQAIKIPRGEQIGEAAERLELTFLSDPQPPYSNARRQG